ncbi:unnamed protein product [Effrenium voratum]|uniref:Pentatricopeptide repeat-containing protein n=1 Tax=Effrenium voratum TaxID=2562239 RepID=A0AA36N8J3_9DINO|nr:unnamed protein product [Effrenium voratum]
MCRGSFNRWRYGPLFFPEVNAQIGQLGRDQLWQEAVALLEELERQQTEPDNILRNAVTSACDKASRWMQALQLMQSGGLAGYSADAFAFTCCISACGKPSRWTDSLQLFARMRNCGPAPSVVTCNAALGAVGKGRRWDLSFKLLRKMCQPRSALPSANAVTFNTAHPAGHHRGAGSLLALGRVAVRATADGRSAAG